MEKTFSRRHIKTIVEACIGILGLFGVLIANLQPAAEAFEERRVPDSIKSAAEIEASLMNLSWTDLLY